MRFGRRPRWRADTALIMTRKLTIGVKIYTTGRGGSVRLVLVLAHGAESQPPLAPMEARTNHRHDLRKVRQSWFSQLLLLLALNEPEIDDVSARGSAGMTRDDKPSAVQGEKKQNKTKR